MPDPADATVFFVGNATMIIRSHGFTLLTDPNFLHRGQWARLGYGLRSRRRTEPAMQVTQLPPVDLVVLSHMHGDHWDAIARDGLDKDLPIVTTRHAAHRLRRQGFHRAIALDPWEYHFVRRHDATLTVTATPARHAPGPVDRLMPPVMGSVLDFAHAGEVDMRMHISGDTIMDPCLAEIPRRFPDIDVGVVHLGGTRILGVTVTMDGLQGAEWLRLMQPESALPVHYDDYEAFASPLKDFQQYVRRAGLSHLVHYLMRGETYRLPVRQAGLRPHRPVTGPGRGAGPPYG
ncbi:MBL fold metallo-hydrolase [Microbispora triticiradicis]|uniref:MBL fold metallo-hydrolase n=2 Tax=Microbispora TaxID=2005 RepID=A0ABY3M678_9ACTN|nr:MULTISPECIES: MBL fold metallo-hydrolase [Microbispora]TLP66411.1 MBL fold metallo-hydrolase [Microbispora fusca]TYB68195.1 MBL fold metallo-hydrolase [Microbispora tritici]